MDLLIWRHAEAFDSSPDITRALTAKGHEQAAIIARWLRPRLPKHCKILVSPATRAQETAQALKLPFETWSAIAPDAPIDNILPQIGWPNADSSVLLVGHQPSLGALAALALTGEKQFWCIKKANLWWIKSSEKFGTHQTRLKAITSPSLIAMED